MSLDIRSDIDAWKSVAYLPDPERPDTHVVLRPEAYVYVVTGSMAVGMGELNEDTAEEWLTRLRAWEIVDGPMLHLPVEVEGEDGKITYEPHHVTMEDLRPFFGTSTNVFPKESAAKFRTRVGDAVMRRAADRR